MSKVYFGSVEFKELGNVNETLPVKMQKILKEGMGSQNYTIKEIE